MISIFRGRSLLAPNASVLRGSRSVLRLTPRRSYTISSYGGENQNASGQSNDPNSRPTKEREHPGPPPPDVSKASPSPDAGARSPSSSAGSDAKSGPSEPAPSQGHPVTQTPSNKAHPTLSDGRQSPYVDDNGKDRPDVPEDVKEHNEKMARRYDRSYNQIGDEGEVQKGF